MRHRPTVLALLLAATLLPATVAASPAHAAACSGTSGVTVVVDYDDGRIAVGCAPGDPASGFDALEKAGFSFTYAGGNGQGALCSINHVPDHACPSMPPADAYWAYFYAEDGRWTYSQRGAGSRNPRPGSVEGWHFRGSSNDGPGIAPPSPATPTKAPTKVPTKAPTRAATKHPRPATSSTAATPTATASATTSASASPTAAATSARPSGTPTIVEPSASTSDSVLAAGSSDPGDPGDGGGSGGTSWILGVVLVLGLGGAGAVTAVRRRRA